jgi:predicted nucleotidyltransferase
MNRDIIMATLEKFKTHAQAQGLNVYAVALKGSQNYNLDDDLSDIDANLVFIPTPQQLRNNKKFKFEFDEGDVVCHNIFAFAEIVAKGNPQWIEVCHSEFMLGDLDIFKDFDVNPSALKGMMMEKVSAFSKRYPSRVKYVEEFGYDPKQLHHIIRLYDVLNKSVKVYKYTDAEKKHMVDIKRGSFPESKEDAFALRDEYVSKIEKIYDAKNIEYKSQSIDWDLLDNIFIKATCKSMF